MQLLGWEIKSAILTIHPRYIFLSFFSSAGWLQLQEGDDITTLGIKSLGDERKITAEETANPQPAEEKKERKIYLGWMVNIALFISQPKSCIT